MSVIAGRSKKFLKILDNLNFFLALLPPNVVSYAM
jgi:hypothetical protein